MKDSFRVRETSNLLGVSISHVYYLIRTKRIKPKREHPFIFNRVTIRDYIRSKHKSFDYFFPETL